LGNALVPRPGGVLDEQGRRVGGGDVRGGPDRLVVGRGHLGDLRPLRLDRGHGGRVDPAGDEDLRVETQHARHRGDGPAVVAVRGGDEPHRRHGRLAQPPERNAGRQPVVVAQRPVHAPRGAEDLERGQPEAGRLVLDEHPSGAQLGGERRQLDERRRGVAGQPPVEGGGVGGGGRAGPVPGGGTGEPGEPERGGSREHAHHASAAAFDRSSERFRAIIVSSAERSGMPMLDLHRLRLLRELKHRGTLAAVAEALSYSPSSISQQLSVLEKEAGVALLEPVGRRVRLTAQAEILVAHTEAVLERLERAEADLAASLRGITGVLRVAAFQTAALALVPDALGALRDAHPRLRVEVTQREPESAIPALLARDFDVVITEEYPGDPSPRPAGVEYAELGEDEITLALPEPAPPGAGLRDLAERPWGTGREGARTP